MIEQKRKENKLFLLKTNKNIIFAFYIIIYE